MKRTIVWGGDPKLDNHLKELRPQLLHVLLTCPADRRRVEESLGGARLHNGIRAVFYHDVNAAAEADKVAEFLQKKVKYQPNSSLEVAFTDAPDWLSGAFGDFEWATHVAGAIGSS